MIHITNITSDPRQNFTIIGESGEKIPFRLYYLPSQVGWFFDISYGDFILNGVRLGVTPNALFSYKNIIPFGLLCGSNDGLDPFYIDDFSSGRINIYLLNLAELNALAVLAI